jgi:hypothetical protein
MPELVVVRPDRAVSAAAATPLAPRTRPGAGAGARIVLVDNGKPNAAALLRAFSVRVAALLDLDPDDVELERKPGAGQPIAADRAEALAGRVSLAITGLGDCGGCSACSVHDAVIFERLGIPAVPVITEPFQGLCAMVAERLGLPALSPIVVPHPVSTKDQDWLEQLAERHARQMATQLAGDIT